MKKNAKNVLNKNFCFSKVLKDIDSKLKFDRLQEGRSLYILSQIKKEERKKLILFEKKYNHREILFNLKRAFEENKLLLKLKGKSVDDEKNKNNKLPKLSKSFNNKQKKDIYNMNGNNNEQIVEFENNWREEYMKSKNKNGNTIKKQKISADVIFDEEDSSDDIFQKGYKPEKKKILEKIKRFKRIKENNQKVKVKLKNYKMIMDKFSEKKEYCPNYSILEKHKPAVKLDSKSERIFPDKLIKMTNYSNDIEIFQKKLFRNNSLQFPNKVNYSINPCSLKHSLFQPINDKDINKTLSKSILIKDKSIIKDITNAKNRKRILSV